MANKRNKTDTDTENTAGSGGPEKLSEASGADPLMALLRAAAGDRLDPDRAISATRDFIRSEAKRAAKKAVKKVAPKKAVKGALAVSPLAPRAFPRMKAIDGVRSAVASTEVKYKNRADFLMVETAPGTTVAGVLTTSRTRSSSVDWCRESLKNGAARLLLVNAGNANAFTGRQGAQATEAIGAAAIDLFGCERADVFMSATGVIGEPLPGDPLIDALPAMKQALSPGGWKDAALAIMTTDTFPKGATRSAEIDGATVTINGIAKGSGMIAPDLATMLAYVFTDAAIPPDLLQTLLMLSVRDSFNAITVDGDTSTSDTVLMFATGRAAHGAVRRPGDARLKDFRRALDEVMLDLAHQIVRDGEGASKFIAITVKGAESAAAAKRIGLSIANSPLVKTALGAGDANWGRIVMAVGKAGEAADRDKLAIEIGGLPVARNGERDPDYDEAAVSRHMRKREIELVVDIGLGRGAATVWTCDLTHGYVDINANYRS